MTELNEFIWIQIVKTKYIECSKISTKFFLFSLHRTMKKGLSIKKRYPKKPNRNWICRRISGTTALAIGHYSYKHWYVRNYHDVNLAKSLRNIKLINRNVSKYVMTFCCKRFPIKIYGIRLPLPTAWCDLWITDKGTI